MTPARQELLDQLAARIDARQVDHTLLVGIDGNANSGKTSLADELVAPLEKLHRTVFRATIDGFHRPKVERYEHGENSPEGYYHDSFNNQAVVEKILSPLSKEGPASYQPAVFHQASDSWVEPDRQSVPPGAIMLFDGLFLFRPELNDYWDFRILLEVEPDELIRRAEVRDHHRFGEQIESRYRLRYIPGYRLYHQEAHPETGADVIIDNTDITKPVIKN